MSATNDTSGPDDDACELLSIALRRIDTGDVDQVLRLLGQRGYVVRPDYAVTSIRRLETAQYDAAFVALIDRDVVGIVYVHAHDLFHSMSRLGRIVALIVADGPRNAEVGAALIARAETFFRDLKCTRIEVTNPVERTAAQRFYRGLGFVEASNHLVKLLQMYP